MGRRGSAAGDGDGVLRCFEEEGDDGKATSFEFPSWAGYSSARRRDKIDGMGRGVVAGG